ncbi:MAG: hypothetical protein ACYDAK_04660 [Candidatus Limnocylindrales bacterium]
MKTIQHRPGCPYRDFDPAIGPRGDPASRIVVVALGVTAVQAVTGQRAFRVTRKEPGTELPSDWGRVVPTLHPAFVRRRGLDGLEYQMLVADLKHARRALGP